MKFTKICLVCMGALALFGCNMGNSVVGNDTQTSSISNNGVANISITATGCKGISSNGGTCTVQINYSAPTGSQVLSTTTYLNLGNLNNYTSNIVSQCGSGAGYFTTTTKSCTVTITSAGSTSSPQQAVIYPSGFQNTQVQFTIGGGV